MAFEGRRYKELQEFIESSMRPLDQARLRVASAVNDSKILHYTSKDQKQVMYQ